MIWQADGGVGHRLEFMYKPVMDTLVDGFRAVPPSIAAKIGLPRIVHGFGVSAFRALAARLLRPAQVQVKVFPTVSSAPQTGSCTLGSGDVFIWIGPVGSDVPPWRELRRRGVRTIYFQTEPSDACQFARSDAQEIWEFSWHNFDACARRLPVGLTMRYVPLGYHAPPVRELAATLRTPQFSGRRGTELLFFGYPFYKSGRGSCYARLARTLGPRLNATWLMWSAEDFEAWWSEHGQWAVHLNLHKTCENAHNPVVFRTALLLSRGATVISERSYWRDEKEYEGLVHFGRVDDLPAMLDRNVVRSAVSAATLSARPLQTSSRVAKMYAERFAPRRIFQRAAIYDALMLNGSIPGPGTSPLPEAVHIGTYPVDHTARGSGWAGRGVRGRVRTGGRGNGGGGRGGRGGGGRGGGGGGGRGGGGGGGGGGVGGKGGGTKRPSDGGASLGLDVAGRRSYRSRHPPTHASYALLLHGRLGTIGAAPSISLVTKLRAVDYQVPIATCAASHIEFVVRANAATNANGQGGVDIFAHTWNPPVGRFFDAEYGKHLRASLHEPLEFFDKEKPRSQALSVGRAARLMGEHEAERKRPYLFCLILRADLLVGAPISLHSFDPKRIWFAEHCCMNEAHSELEKAAVHAKCDAIKGDMKSDPRYSKVLTGRFNYRKRVLGPCRVTQYGGYWGLEKQREDYYYVVRLLPSVPLASHPRAALSPSRAVTTLRGLFVSVGCRLSCLLAAYGLVVCCAS